MPVIDLKQAADVVASIAVLYLVPECEIATSGNVGDKALALSMIDHAIDAIRNRVFTPSQATIVIPNRDVDLKHHAAFPVKEFGSMLKKDRGDQPNRLTRGRDELVHARVSILKHANGHLSVDVESNHEGKAFILAMLADARTTILRRVNQPPALAVVK